MFNLPNAPWDIRLGAYFFRLVRDPETQRLMWSRKPLLMFPNRVTERATTQANFPPDARVPFTYPNRAGGFGLARIDGAEEVNRYRYTGAREGMVDEGVDCSLGTVATLSGKVNRVTLPTVPTGTEPKFIPFAGNLYLIGGRYVYRLDNGALGWTQTADLGIGITVTDAATFRGTQAGDRLYLACGPGADLLVSTDGATFTAAAGIRAERLTKIEGRLYRYLNGEVRFATDGGPTPTFTGPIDVGDKMGTGNAMYAHGGRVVIGKSVGLFVLAGNTETLDQNLHPEMWNNEGGPEAFTRGVSFRNQLLVRFQGSLRSYSPGFAVSSIGPETVTDNNSPATGAATAFDADQYYIYATLESGFLMKGIPVHNPVDGSLSKVTWHTYLQLGGSGASAAKVWTGPSGTDPQLYMLLAGGVVARTVLPRTGNQLADTRFQFCPGGVLYEPDYYGGFYQEDKLVFSVSADAERLSATETLQHSYRPPMVSSYTTVATLQTVSPGQRIDLPTPVRMRGIPMRLTFQTGTAATSPILRSHSLSYLVATDPMPSIGMVIDLRQGAMLADGSRQELDPETASRRLYSLVNAGPVTLLDPWGRLLDVTVPLEGFQEDSGEAHDNRRPDMFVALRVVGQKARLKGTFASLATYRFSDLAALKFSDLVRV